jgi:predicted amidophosphoribosyltransferase
VDNLWITLLDVLAPKRGSSPKEYYNRAQLRALSPKIHTSEHRHSAIRHHFYLLEYRDTAVASLFHRAKFEGEYAILQDFISDTIPAIQALAAQYGPYDLIVPVAPDVNRSIQRGYSVASLAMPLWKQNGLKTSLLLNKIHSKPERNKQTRSIRMTLSPDNYTGISYEGHLTRVLLFDDIITTGSTLQEHAIALHAQYPHCTIDTLCISGG